jgi:undecaprenyl-diphosphatase
LLAILAVYKRRVWRLFHEDRRVIGLLLVGSIPAAIVGIALKKWFEPWLESALLAGFMFPVTGILLIWAAGRQTGNKACRELTYPQALIIGAFQALAILPGVSRSGATIVAGLGCNLRREEAATFSFLLAIPAIGGAGVLEMAQLLSHQSSAEPLALLGLGLAISFSVGLVSLMWLLQWLKKGRLHLFAWWVLLLGPVVVVWQLLY